MGERHMDYISVRQAAVKWGISECRCWRKTVSTALCFGHVWMIPKSSDKPPDARIKSGKYRKAPTESSVNE